MKTDEIKSFYTDYHDGITDKRFESPFVIRRYAHRTNYETMVACVRQILRPGMRILDEGCGEGVLLRLVRDAAPDALIIGSDISKPNIQAARNLGRGIYLVADAEYLPFKTGAFDLVISSHVLEHLPDFHRGLHDLKRVTSRWALIGLPTCLNLSAMILLGTGGSYWKPDRKSFYALLAGFARVVLNLGGDGVDEGYEAHAGLTARR
jgi:2-polyprenyl-3-methyl-5-hydroxy-6-metoxy-1,4-benzoquinol methylase